MLIPCVECQSQVSDTASACPNCGMQNPNWRFNHQNDERDIFKVINARVARIKALPVEGQKEIKANIGVCNMFSTPIMLAMMLITIMMLYWFFTDNLVYAGKALYPAGITYILGFIMYQIENRIVERAFAKYENNR